MIFCLSLSIYKDNIACFYVPVKFWGSALDLTTFRNIIYFIPCLTDSLVAHKNNGYKTAQKVSHTILPILCCYNAGLVCRSLSARLVLCVDYAILFGFLDFSVKGITHFCSSCFCIVIFTMMFYSVCIPLFLLDRNLELHFSPITYRVVKTVCVNGNNPLLHCTMFTVPSLSLQKRRTMSRAARFPS